MHKPIEEILELVEAYHQARQSGTPESKITTRKAIADALLELLAPPAAKAEPMIRFCPGCGSVGPVDEKFRDCCPDGSHARMIPQPLAEKCRDLFKLALDGALAATPAAPAPAWADQAVIEYQYTGGAHWCPLGPAERMSADFDGVYRLQPGAFPTLAAPADALDAVKQAVSDFHFALDSRQHGGIAAHQAINAIEAALGMPWEQGSEAERRAAIAAQGGKQS